MNNQVHTCVKGIIAAWCLAVADRRLTKQLLCLAALALAAMLILIPSAGAQGDQYASQQPGPHQGMFAEPVGGGPGDLSGAKGGKPPQPAIGESKMVSVFGGPGDPSGAKGKEPPPYDPPKTEDGSAAQNPSMNGKDTPTQKSSKTSKDISSSQTSSKTAAIPSSQQSSATQDDASVREAPKAGGDSAAQEPSTGILQTLSSSSPYLQGGLPLVAAGSLSGWFWFIWWFFL